MSIDDCKTEVECEVNWRLASNRLKYCADELEILAYDLNNPREQIQIDILLSEAQDMIDEMSFLMDKVREAQKTDGSNT